MAKRYLYLMQKGNANVLKIGVSNRPFVRKAWIKKNVPDIQIIRCIKTRRAEYWERYLHDKYATSRFTLRGGGSGRTEYFKVNWLEFAFIFLDYWYIKNRAWVLPIGWFALIAWALFYSVGNSNFSFKNS